MFKIRFTIILILLLQFNVILAQSVRNRHNIAFWGAGGYTNILNDADNVRSLGRVGFGVGGGYELHRRIFILQTGLEFQNLRGVLAHDDFVHRRSNMIDTDGHLYIGSFYYTENRDFNSLGYLNIPLMFGLQGQRFYFLVGGKAGMNLFGNSSSRGTVRAIGDYYYPNLLGPFETPHEFGIRQTRFDSPVEMRLNYMLSAEIGRVFRVSNITYRLALFGDYGLANIRNNSYWENVLRNEIPLNEMPVFGDMIGFLPMPYYRPMMNSLVRSAVLENNFLNSLFVGVRLTMVIGLPERRECRWFLCTR